MGRVLPSRWGIRLIDLFFVLVIIALVARFIAPTSGLSVFFQQIFHFLALGVQLFANALVQFFNWI